MGATEGQRTAAPRARRAAAARVHGAHLVEVLAAALRGAEDVLAAMKQSNDRLDLLGAENDVLRVRENSGDSLADGALDIHEEGIGALHLSLELVHELLLGGVNVNEIDFHFVLDVIF